LIGGGNRRKKEKERLPLKLKIIFYVTEETPTLLVMNAKNP